MIGVASAGLSCGVVAWVVASSFMDVGGEELATAAVAFNCLILVPFALLCMWRESSSTIAPKFLNMNAGAQATSLRQPLAPNPSPHAQHSTVMMAGAAGVFKPKLKFVDAALVSELEPGKAKSAVVAGLDICIIQDAIDGKYYAVGNKCPPTGTPVSQGRVNSRDKTIEDPQNGSEFNYQTGEPVRWCTRGVGILIGRFIEQGPLPCFKIKKSGNKLQIEVNVNAKADFESNYWRGILDAQGKTDGGYY